MIRPICLLLLNLFFVVQGYSQSRSIACPDRVTIVTKQVLIVRKGKFARDVPSRRKATIRYPVVSGLRDRAVLLKVRSLVHFENVFDTSLREYREWNWLDEFDYSINHNADCILDLTFTQIGTAAYPDSQSKTLSINLKTGNVLKASDVFVEERFNELAKAVDEKLQVEVMELIKAAKGHEDAASIVEALEELKFEVKNLNDFSISRDGVTFLYDVGFPHVHSGFEPEGRYLFSYSSLKPFIRPDGPIAKFVRY